MGVARRGLMGVAMREIMGVAVRGSNGCTGSGILSILGTHDN